MRPPARVDAPHVIIGLVLVRLLAAVLLTINEPGGLDSLRFHQLATAPGNPYEDYVTEYPPLTLVLLRGLGGETIRDTATRVVWIALIFDFATMISVWAFWGRRTASIYLLLGTLMLPYSLTVLDGLPLVLAVTGMGLASRGREAAGGSMIAMGAVAKLWPLVLVPALVGVQRRRAAWWAVGVTAAATAAWVAISGPRAIGQVLGFRGATGWEIGSTPGAMRRLFTDLPTVFEAGALRIGETEVWEKIALAGIGLAMVLMAVHWASGRTSRLLPVVSVSSVLMVSPLFSAQFMMWLVPWAAISRMKGIQVFTGIGAIASTALWVIINAGGPDPGFRLDLILLIRILAVGSILWIALRSMVRNNN